MERSLRNKAAVLRPPPPEEGAGVLPSTPSLRTMLNEPSNLKPWCPGCPRQGSRAREADELLERRAKAVELGWGCRCRAATGRLEGSSAPPARGLRLPC